MKKQRIYYLSNEDYLAGLLKSKVNEETEIIKLEYNNYDNKSIILLNSIYIELFIDFIKRNKERIYVYSHGFSYYSYLKAKELNVNYFYLICEYEKLNEFIDKIINKKSITHNIKNLSLTLEELEIIKDYAFEKSIKAVAKKRSYEEKSISSKLSRIYKKLDITGINQMYIASIKNDLFSRDDFYGSLLYKKIKGGEQ